MERLRRKINNTAAIMAIVMLGIVVGMEVVIAMMLSDLSDFAHRNRVLIVQNANNIASIQQEMKKYKK